MDRVRAPDKGFREPCQDTLGKEGKQFPRAPQGGDEPKGLAQGHAPPRVAPAGLSRRILLPVQPQLYEGGHI